MLIGNQGGKALKWLPAHFNFGRKIRLLFRECVHKFGTFCPEVRRRTRDGAFIYALSADETSSALAASRHTITALFSCCFKCACPFLWQPHFRSNADRAYNTLHFASKVVCQRVPLWKPRTTKQAEYQTPGKCEIFSLFCCQQPPFRSLRVVPCKLT
ncbi:hypothetical protein EVA_06877 [gut metagenome]|uniref:Uncharacterized protein n=1 Tax=gut metagenome TaxID=749906 RepID=J9GCD5_9ZZZZ